MSFSAQSHREYQWLLVFSARHNTEHQECEYCDIQLFTDPNWSLFWTTTNLKTHLSLQEYVRLGQDRGKDENLITATVFVSVWGHNTARRSWTQA